jgi:hypothetical protein
VQVGSRKNQPKPRAQFSKDLELLQQSLKVGDRVLSDGDFCELTQIGGDLIGQDPHVGTACVVMFRTGETMQEHRYSTMFGNAKGSARLQRPPPSLTPSQRALRKDTVSERTLQLVKTHAYDTCSQSPCKRDTMRKQVIFKHRQSCTKDTLWTLFKEKHPNLLTPKQYFGVLDKEVWNLQKVAEVLCQKVW